MKHYCYICKNCDRSPTYNVKEGKCTITGLPVNITKGRKCKNFKDEGGKFRKLPK